jgi:hypothetical protein
MRTLSLAALLFFVGCLDEQTASTTAAVGDDQRHPPQEAVDACASSTSGDACAFDIDGHHIAGTCKSCSANAPLACAPVHPLPPKEAVDACASLSDGATCSFDIDDHHLDGICRSPSADFPLACAPDQPPPR